MSVGSRKGARRRSIEHYGKSPAQRRQGRSVAAAIEAERKKAARAAQIKK